MEHIDAPPTAEDAAQEPADAGMRQVWAPSHRQMETETARREDEKSARSVIYKANGLTPEQIEEMEEYVETLDAGKKPRKPSGRDDEGQRWAWDMLDQVRDVGRWPVPPLSSHEGPIEHAQIVVHPLFTLFLDDNWDAALWEKSDGDGRRYAEAAIVKIANLANETARNCPEGDIPMGYFLVQELLTELGELDAPPAQNEIRILDLSRRSMIGDPKRRGAYDSFLKSIGTSRTYAVESFAPGTGLLQQKDLDLLKNAVSPHGSVSFQGEYLGACLSAASESFLRSVSKKGREDISVTMDSEGSLGSTSVPTDRINRTTAREQLNDPRFSPDQRQSIVPFLDADIRSSPQGFSSIDDVRKWVAQHSQANDAYKKYSRLHMIGVDLESQADHADEPLPWDRVRYK